MLEWLNYSFSTSWLPHSYSNSHILDEVDYIKKISSNLHASVLDGGYGTTTKPINLTPSPPVNKMDCQLPCPHTLTLVM